MGGHPQIYTTRELAEQTATMREAAARAAKALKQSAPDTFLGRKTYEPFPMTNDEAERWVDSPGLQPPK